MDTRTGISFGISFLLVVVAAVALHRPEPSTQVSQVAKPVEAVPVVRDTVTPEPPLPTPGQPWPSPVSATLEPKPVEIAREDPRPDPPRTSPAPVRKVSRPSQPRKPKSAFTTVAQGESLADVAYRVYGSDDAARKLWLANRDHLERPDDPLRPGTALRTP